MQKKNLYNIIKIFLLLLILICIGYQIFVKFQNSKADSDGIRPEVIVSPLPSTSTEDMQEDSTTTKADDKEILSWKEIPDGDTPLPLDFDKWLAIMNHIRDNYWARPTAKMLADIDLKALYEYDDFDVDSIKDVHFMYGRQTKCMTDSTGEKYHTYDGSHAVIFEVFAYTSSGAEISFHNPADMKDFMEQAIKRGVVACQNEMFIVCDKPIGEGLHKLKKVYDHTETNKGAFKELYYLYPVFKPGAEWQTCHVTLDFLRHRIDVE